MQRPPIVTGPDLPLRLPRLFERYVSGNRDKGAHLAVVALATAQHRLRYLDRRQIPRRQPLAERGDVHEAKVAFIGGGAHRFASSVCASVGGSRSPVLSGRIFAKPVRKSSNDLASASSRSGGRSNCAARARTRTSSTVTLGVA